MIRECSLTDVTFFSGFLSAQPVHDELEYIKMRYKSPARSSFRDNKTYETLTTRSTYSTIDRGLDGPHGPNYSDDSMVDCSQKDKGSTFDKKEVRGEHPQQQQQQQPAWTNLSSPTEGQTDLGNYGSPHNSQQRHFNIIGQTQGVTVIWLGRPPHQRVHVLSRRVDASKIWCCVCWLDVTHASCDPINQDYGSASVQLKLWPTMCITSEALGDWLLSMRPKWLLSLCSFWKHLCCHGVVDHIVPVSSAKSWAPAEPSSLWRWST